MPKTQTEYHTKYRMVAIPEHHLPDDTAKLMESMSESGWTPITFVPYKDLGPGARTRGHMLMARVER